MSPQEAIAKLLAQCAEDKDTQESPKGSNRGKRVEVMLANTGLGGGYPWCAAAVATWGIEALANGTVLTWEGNTNNDGSREGYRVCQRHRTTSNLVYVRWVDDLHLPEGAPDVRPLETPAYRVWISPYGEFPKIQMHGGRPCAPVRQLVAAILGMSLENTVERVGWIEAHHVATVNGRGISSTYLVTDNASRSTAWAPVREIAEALGCVVSAGANMVTIGSPVPLAGEVMK